MSHGDSWVIDFMSSPSSARKAGLVDELSVTTTNDRTDTVPVRTAVPSVHDAKRAAKRETRRTLKRGRRRAGRAR